MLTAMFPAAILALGSLSLKYYVIKMWKKVTGPCKKTAAVDDDVEAPARSSGIAKILSDYDVVFKDGPLGMGLQKADFGFAEVKLVVDGGQAAVGGVRVKDVIKAVNAMATDYDEFVAFSAELPRPFTVSFCRAAKTPSPPASKTGSNSLGALGSPSPPPKPSGIEMMSTKTKDVGTKSAPNSRSSPVGSHL